MTARTATSGYDFNDAGPIKQLTFEGHNQAPLWLDDERIVFTSDRQGDQGLFSQRVDGGPAERLATPEQGIRPSSDSWSPDSKVLIFTNRIITGLAGYRDNAGISALYIGTDQEPKRIIKQHASNSSLSPDGRWLAYVGTEDIPKLHLYVEPFPPTPEGKRQITDYGGNPLWSPDGKQLYFMRLGRQILSVDIQTKPSLSWGKITPLPIDGIVNPGPRPYDITSDGKFVVMFPAAQPATNKAPPAQINVTLNWFEELKQRASVH